ncbi:MAG: histidinol-phosphate transaminase [Acidimicrobiales bacterium]|nr:histidinol-phosphate transaminase [Acidimicrobiales bacterium]
MTESRRSHGRPRPAVAGLPAYKPGKAAEQANREHNITDAIKLASNESPFGPLDAVRAAVEAGLDKANRYADHRATAVRSRIAAIAGVDTESVMVGAGSAGLLQQLVLTYVDPGDEVIYPWRSFEVYPVFTQLVGGTAITTPLAGHAFDLDAVAAAVTERTKLILLANPNNPTGTALPMGAFAELLEQVPEPVIVVLDEAYREFMDPALGDSVSDLLDRYPNLVVLRTFSKAHGLAAFRVGYGFGHPDVVETIDRTLVPFVVNGLAQVAALAALDAADEVAARVASVVEERRRVHAELVHQGWPLPPSETNFVWLPLGDRTDEITLDMERRGIVARPFSGEGLRITIGTAEQNDRFLQALAEVAPS